MASGRPDSRAGRALARLPRPQGLAVSRTRTHSFVTARRTTVVPASCADVILAGQESRATLAFARSLAHNQVPFVLTTEHRRGAFVGSSRSVRRRVLSPSALREPDAFVEHLIRLVVNTGANVVVPLDDDTLFITNEHRDSLAEAGAVLAAGPARGVRNILDKRAHLETAASLGIPCPAQFLLTDSSDIPELLERLDFPMVLKKARRGVSGEFPFKWLVVDDELALRSVLHDYCAEGAYPLCQELVRGRVVGLYGFATQGELPAIHATAVSRRSNGESVLRTTISLDPALAEHARAIVRELNWDGICTFAFFVTGDGTPRFMEMNGRAPGTLEGSIRAGWDMPLWTVRYFAQGQRPNPPPLVLGSSVCWRLGDLRHLAYVIAGRRWLIDFHDVSRSRAVLDYLGAFRPSVHSDVFRVDDPFPEVVEHMSKLRDVAGAVRPRRRS